MATKTDKGEMPEPETQAVPDAVKAEPVVEQEEEFDKSRAMDTIHKQRDEIKEYKKAVKELADLKEKEQKRQEAEMSELQKAQKLAAELEAKLVKQEHQALQRKVADAVGLPPFMADRLKGEDEEELVADAKALLENLPSQKSEKKQTPNISPTNPASASLGETLAQKKERLGLTQRKDIFSDQFNYGKDGGVVTFSEG